MNSLCNKSRPLFHLLGSGNLVDAKNPKLRKRNHSESVGNGSTVPFLAVPPAHTLRTRTEGGGAGSGGQPEPRPGRGREGGSVFTSYKLKIYLGTGNTSTWFKIGKQ